MTGSEDLQLESTLQRAANGDELAWRDLVDAYAPRVYGLLKAQCGNHDLAEDITQSTFCTVVSKLAGYTEQGRFESWLFRIAMNRLRDEMRRRKRHAVSVEEDTLTNLAGADEGGPAPASSDDPTIAALRDAMEKLSDSDRQIVHLRHFGGLSFRQIADVLDQPVGTVLARQHRALRKLKELMGSAGREP